MSNDHEERVNTIPSECPSCGAAIEWTLGEDPRCRRCQTTIQDDVRAAVQALAARRQAQQADEDTAAALAAVVGRDGTLEGWAAAIETACREAIASYDAAGGPVPLRLVRTELVVNLRADDHARPASVSLRTGPSEVTVTIQQPSVRLVVPYSWVLVDGALGVVLGPDLAGTASALVEHVVRPWLRATLANVHYQGRTQS